MARGWHERSLENLFHEFGLLPIVAAADLPQAKRPSCDRYLIAKRLAFVLGGRLNALCFRSTTHRRDVASIAWRHLSNTGQRRGKRRAPF